MVDKMDTTQDISRGFSRRTLVKTAAWTAPTVAVVVGIPEAAHASPGATVVLFTSNFDSIGSGLPTNFSVVTGASTTAVGTAATFTTAQAAWNSTTFGFKNVASADGLVSTSDATAQNASTDRAVAVRQTGTTNSDPGAAFVIDIGPTTNRTNVTVSFSAQSLDASSPRVTTFVVDAFIGGTTRVDSGTTFTTGGSTFSNTIVTASFASALDNLASNVQIRIAAVTGSSGGGNRATTAIDDLTVSATSTV